jgi:hypothetical protein
MSEFEINYGHGEFDDSLQSLGLNLDLEVTTRDGDVDGFERAEAAGEWVDQRFVGSDWWLRPCHWSSRGYVLNNWQ